MNVKKLLCAGLSAVMLVGCSSSSETTSDETTSVVVAFDADLNTMDHHIATDGNSFIMQSMCFSGLTQLAEDGTAEPALADSWEVSDDGLTYTFYLNEDATWSNGEPVTADDFVFAWQRLDDPDTASEYAFILETIHVVNAGEINAGEMDVSELGVRAVDDKTFEVTLTLPCDYLLGLMAFPSFFPLNEEFYTEHEDTYAQSTDDMIYCGPYEMTGWVQGSEYTFTKRDDYFAADEDAVDEVTFKYIQDTQSAMLSYEQGDIDVVKLQSDQVDAYEDEDGFYNTLQGYVWYLSLNFADTSIQNDNLRAALAYAIDRDAIAEDVLKDGSIGCTGLVGSSFAYNDEGVDFRDYSGTLTATDTDLAAEYYAAAVEELGGDVTIELLYEDSEASKAVAENLQAQIQAACPGITITLNSKPKKTRLELMQNGEYQIGLTRWGPDYADPQTFMERFVTGNDAGYSNAEYDALVESACNGEDATDSEARWEDFAEAEKILVEEDHGVIPVYQNGGAMMINPDLTGINFHSGGVDDYRFMHLAS